MQLQVPENFWHAGDLPARYSSRDPRQPSFAEERLDLDLRRCQFVRPAALLWCCVYALLARARSTNCRLLVPESMGLCLYLKSVGLVRTLQEAGVEIDDRGVGDRVDRQLIVPLTRFRRETEVEDLANRALEELSKSGRGSSNLYPLVSEVSSR